MKKIILSALILATFFACEKLKTSAICGDYQVNMKFVDDGDKILMRINGESVILNLVQSASGAKYDGVMKNNDVLTMWNKGDGWTMFINDGQPIMCK